MNPICPVGQAAGKRSAYATAIFLRRIEREHVAAMYRWSHPYNVEWAAARATAHTVVQAFCIEARR
jgi:hypothetical protein